MVKVSQHAKYLVQRSFKLLSRYTDIMDDHSTCAGQSEKM